MPTTLSRLLKLIEPSEVSVLLLFNVAAIANTDLTCVEIEIVQQQNRESGGLTTQTKARLATNRFSMKHGACQHQVVSQSETGESNLHAGSI